jgi:hypothetical protein
MVKHIEVSEDKRTEFLINSVKSFLDYSWDRNNGGLRWQKRFFEKLLEGFVISEFCQSVGDIERSEIVGIWFKLSELMDRLHEYKASSDNVNILLNA